jgi:hypothetical protein
MERKCAYIMNNNKKCSRARAISGFLIPYTIGYNKCGVCQQHFDILSKVADNRKNANSLLTVIPHDCLYLILAQIGFKDQWSIMVSSFRMSGIMREWVYNTPLIRKFNFQKKYEALYQKQLEDYANKHHDLSEIRFYGVDSYKLMVDSYSTSFSITPRIVHYLAGSWGFPWTPKEECKYHIIVLSESS